MAQISVTILNSTSSDQNVHVYDSFAGGNREVDGSPFALATNEASGPFGVNADASENGVIAFRADGGPSLSNIAVTDGSSVSMT